MEGGVKRDNADRRFWRSYASYNERDPLLITQEAQTYLAGEGTSRQASAFVTTEEQEEGIFRRWGRKHARAIIVTTVLLLLGIVIGMSTLYNIRHRVNPDASDAAQISVLPVVYNRGSTGASEDNNTCNIINIPIDIFDEAISLAFVKFDDRRKVEIEIDNKGIMPTKDMASFYHQLFLKTDGRVKFTAEHALITEFTTNHLRIQYNMTNEDVKCIVTPKNDTYIQQTYSSLYEKKFCDANYKYRSVDGTCNNLQHPHWGSAYTPYLRLLPPDYSDGVSAPRQSRLGNPLPSARQVSTQLYQEDGKTPPGNCTMMAVMWGLLIDHDITSTASTTGNDGKGITCCDARVLQDPNLRHPDCFPIEIPEDDEFFKDHNQTCMEFVRSAPAALSQPGPRQQINQITSYLDGSAIYGSTSEHHFHLRLMKKGKLRTSLIHGTPVMPEDTNPNSTCGQPNRGMYCFHGGDIRANEQVFLTALHTLFMREHNRVADELSKLNPHWDDETLFQETRRIIVAEMQHITYNEYLPLILGARIIDKCGATIQKEGYFEGYNAEMDASSSNVFATSAFRVGHSQVTGHLQLVSKVYKTISDLLLHWTFFNPATIYQKGLDVHTRGMIMERANPIDSEITEELRNHLFQPFNGTFGLDLPALGIQRGRDHGLPSYTDWFYWCHYKVIKEWDDLNNVTVKSKLKILKRLYKSPQDIDLTPGALSEKTLPGSMVGTTHACLISEQFHRLKRGDRFWYENNEKTGYAFTPDQLQAIRNITLSRILCDNSDDFDMVPQRAFEPSGRQNPVSRCSEYQFIPLLNLNPWKEKR